MLGLGGTDHRGYREDSRESVFPSEADPGKPYLLSQSLEYSRSEIGSARSGNVVWQTRQSLASSDFRLVFKKHSDANQGKHGIAF